MPISSSFFIFFYNLPRRKQKRKSDYPNLQTQIISLVKNNEILIKLAQLKLLFVKLFANFKKNNYFKIFSSSVHQIHVLITV